MLLKRLSDLMQTNIDDLAMILALEQCKTLTEACSKMIYALGMSNGSRGMQVTRRRDHSVAMARQANSWLTQSSKRYVGRQKSL